MSFNLIFHCTLRLFLIKLSEEKLVSYVGDLRLTLTRVFGGERHYIQYCALLIKCACKGVVRCYPRSVIRLRVSLYKNNRVRRGKGIIFNIVRLVLSKRKGAVGCYPTSVIRLRVQ